MDDGHGYALPNITDNVIAPKINQSTMQVHPVLSLTALVVGSTFGGAAGMIVALPLVAVIKSLFIFYFETRTGEQIVSYEGALFRGAPFRDAQATRFLLLTRWETTVS